jgi:murein DD-endopeptidase MepM/ murein hydrolase activator NlpD
MNGRRLAVKGVGLLLAGSFMALRLPDPATTVLPEQAVLDADLVRDSTEHDPGPGPLLADGTGPGGRKPRAANVLAGVPWRDPLLRAGSLSRGYSSRPVRHPILGIPTAHWGVDFAAPHGTPVYTAAPGRVVYTGWRGGFGRTIEIAHGVQWITRYAHLSSINVSLNDSVQPGRRIGLVGSTGLSTGPHLHYEIFYNGATVDPLAVWRQARQIAEKLRQ